MLKYIAIVAGVAIIALLIVAAMQPPTYHVERTTTIAATPDKIHFLVDDFHNWQQWSPWGKLDPNVKVTYSGPPSGAGAVYEWQGNRKVGKGRMQILATQPTETSIKLDFLEPFKSQNITNFVLDPEGPVTRVTWTMDGPNTFMSKLMGVFVSMDKMVGKDFETGLGNLKAAAER
ncbi:MAG TPA: SRPBCC family protein [Candidatus Aquilonibacter sp.]|nr:SRPBCC family protein [Candidatus Aquilonibacter sp.]